MREPTAVIAHPAATVVVLRDGASGCEVLLVRRNAQLAFHGGAWVFPGGRVDAGDHTAAGGDPIGAARQAAIREAREEAGLVLPAEELVLLSRWVTPIGLPKRFDTWFFVAPGTDAPVEVDGGEIHDHRWISAAAALAAHRTAQIELPPPTFVTITAIARYSSAGAALTAFAAAPPEVFEPKLYPIEGGAVTLYAGDAGYDAGDLESPGPRHRLWMTDGGWRYEREP
jgi:8-oxo-dGTP pyrophosphatase MutT (NUDIX family)